MAIWTTTDLLAEVRRLAMLPASSTTAATDTDVLAALDGEIQTRMVPLLLRVNEEFLVKKLTFPIYSGYAEYQIWHVAIASRLRDVAVVNGQTRYHLPRLRPETRDRYTTSMTGQPSGFIVDAGQIILMPTPNFNGTLETDVYVRPGKLVATTSARQLTNVTDGNNYLGSTTTGRTQLQWSGAIDFSTTTNSSKLVDVYSGLSPVYQPGFYEPYASAGGAVTSIDVATAGTFGSSYFSASRYNIGDWISKTGESAVANIPQELQPVLCQRVAARMLRTLGYVTEAGAADSVAREMEEAAILMLTPRTDGNPKRLSSGALGLIGRGASGYWRW